MEENEKIIVEEKKEEEINKDENNDIKNIEEEKNMKNKQLSENNGVIDNEKDEEENLLNNNKDIINSKEKEEIINNINNKVEDKNPNLIIGDYLITIKKSKLLHIPYFTFGNVLNFYFFCQNFKSDKIKLSQMPTPPFGIIIEECKLNILYF